MWEQQQRSAVCNILASAIGLGSLWEEHGPTDEARRLLEDPTAPLSFADHTVLRIAWLLWDRNVDLQLSELFALAPAELELVGTLLAALAQGDDSVETWIRHNLPTGEVDEQPKMAN